MKPPAPIRILASATLVLALALPGHAQAPAGAPDAEFRLIRELSAALREHRDDEARRRAQADPALALAAFEELLADALDRRLTGNAAFDESEDALLVLLASASGSPQPASLLARLSRATRDSNPFDEAGAGVERALAAYALVASTVATEDPAALVAQPRRAEAALAAARDARCLIAETNSLALLGLFAFQGGDMATARRHWSEALNRAELSGHVFAGILLRRNLALAFAQERDLVGAIEQARSAAALLSSPALASSGRIALGPLLYRDLVGYMTLAGDRDSAIEFATRSVELLDTLKAPPAERADALETLAQLHAQSASAGGGSAAARRGAQTFVSVAEVYLSVEQPERATIALLAAGVLLLENVNGREARPPFERVLDLATRLGDEPTKAGVALWIGRTYLAEARAESDPTAARAALDRAVASLRDAEKRSDALERAGVPAANLRTLRAMTAFWLGQAHMRDAAPVAADHFRRAFDLAVEAGDVNNAVNFGESVLRTLSRAGDEASVRKTALDLFDRLVALNRVSPLRIADALAAALLPPVPAPGDHIRPQPLAPAVLALYERTEAALEGANLWGVSPLDARAASIIVAAQVRDRARLAALAGPVFDEIVASGNGPGAQDLAEAVTDAWDDLDDSAQAARWRARLEPLVEISFKAARAANRFDSAAREADKLARAAARRGDSAAEAAWAREAVAARRDQIETDERAGRLGLASAGARALARSLFEMSDWDAARRWYTRAADLATRTGDRRERASALTGRAHAELRVGDARSALATVHEVLRLLSASQVPGDDPRTYGLPQPASLAMPEIAGDALSVRVRAFEALAASEADTSARSVFLRSAEASRALIAQLPSTPN